MSHEQQRYRGVRDRDRRRDGSIDGRDDSYYRSSRHDYRDRDRDRDRDRRRSRDRYGDRTRSPDRRRNRSRDGYRRRDDSRTRYDSRKAEDHRRRDDSRDRARSLREQTADSQGRDRRDDTSRSRTPLADDGKEPENSQKPAAGGAKKDADKIAERLAKLEAWKKKKMEKESAAASPQASSGTPPTESSAKGNLTAPSAPALGKFAPKQIPKKTLPSVGAGKVAGNRRQPAAAADGPIKFSFGKSAADSDKVSAKKHLLDQDQDEEETVTRKFPKFAALSDQTADPTADQPDEMVDEMADETPADETLPDATTADANEDPLDKYMRELEGTDAAETTDRMDVIYSDDNIPEEEEDGGRLPAAVNNKRKKDIPTVDYEKLNLEPARKNFWSEPLDLKDLTPEEVTELRFNLDDIKVKGTDVPKPVQKWAQCGLTRDTLDLIDEFGYKAPTSIQMQAIPALMSGRDLVGVAKTGSGKTLAFLLPMFRHIMNQPAQKKADGPIGLIMAPTRELVTQIYRDCKPFLKTMGLRAMAAYGGAPIRDQIADLKRGAEIVVCTPGRLIDLLIANKGRVINLARTTYVVLDEADRMFDMGFEPQIRKIFANSRPDKQTVLFSATMPRTMASMTKAVLKDPVEIIVGGRSVVAKEIEQIVEVREEPTKFVRVLELVGELHDRDDDARTLLFVNRQEKADELVKELLMKGFPCMSIHGGKDQEERDSTISDFKNGIIPILVATSVAARGLDVKQLKLVINYDAPSHLEDYVHRAGRTGRAGNTGVAVTFITPEQDNCASYIAKALEESQRPVPDEVEAMRKAYKDKVASGQAKFHSGFGGKGLERLEQEREATRMRERQAFGVEGEGEDAMDNEKGKEDGEKTEKALNATKAAASSVQARDKSEGAESKTPSNETPGAATGESKSTMDKVSSAISAINSRLGKAEQPRTGQPIDNKGPDAGAFHATLEINDFPQKARWAATNRTNVARIIEETGTSITTKGTYYPPGKEVPAGAERKLYILIEGDTEVVVSSALYELQRLLQEGAVAAAEADKRAPVARGRYTIT